MTTYNKMTEEEKIKENKKLCKEFPFLIPRNRWTGKISQNYDYSYTELCDDGWRELQLEFFREIKPLLEKANFVDKYRIIESKEKWGYWHLYNNGIPRQIWDEYHEILRKYEKLSEHTCVNCGDRNAKMTFGEWIYPCCRKCWESNKYLNNIPYETITKEPTYE